MKNTLIFWVIILLALGVVACTPKTPTDTFLYQVKVQDKSNSEEIGGAIVRLTPFGGTVIRTTTNDEGIASFTLDSSLIGKSAQINVEAVGYEKNDVQTSLTLGGFPFAILLNNKATSTLTSTSTPNNTPSSTPTDASSTETSTPSPTATETPTYTLTPSPYPTTTPTPTSTFTLVPPPSSQQIAYVSEQEGLPKVFIMNDDGSNPRLLITDMESSCQPTWSPDGSKLLFVSPCMARNENVDIAYPNADIFIAEISPDGKASEAELLISVTNGAYDPDWSSYGILFTGLGEGKPLVYFSDLSGNDQLLSSDLGAGEKLAKWIPGTEFILFFRENTTQLFVGAFSSFSAPITSNYQITHQTESPLYASFSPAGDTVAFTSKLTNGEGGTIKPSWHISVLNWVWNLNNPQAQQNEQANRLTKDGKINTDPDWSPDGKWIAFAFYDDRLGSQFDIYAMTQGGGSIHPLTNIEKENDPTDPDEYQPAWRPSPINP